MAAKRGIFVAPFDELYEPRLLAELAAQAEGKGWDGFFLWDHIKYREPVRAVADPWVALSAIAYATERIRIGPLVTPLSRRRVQKLARETVTLDHLSGGRLVLGVGLGSDHSGELADFGEVTDPRERAQLLDEGLQDLAAFWSGGFEPPPLQQPRIPVWVAGRWPKRKPLRRAARWDGFFPIELEEPDQLAQLVKELYELRGGRCEVIVENPPGTDPAPWEAAGATWCLTSFQRTPREADVRAAIAAG
ncbi:MAG TPA: LLM class flavin-dependent oxidoreductase [Thermoleophilaceae bacterium]|nr:LLM class flavin-dependent oxidoreductase [Thermoleophilaceae bacterium]